MNMRSNTKALFDLRAIDSLIFAGIKLFLILCQGITLISIIKHIAQ
jgi:hypothetical protein